ncbi:MAG: exodeoxyribonuclease V subunit gamma [Acidimicrobiales bacterium]
MLQLHRASRGDALAAGLAELLRRPVGDPFAREIVSVPTRGVERWLTQQLSGVLGARPGRPDGVCANVEFPFPAAVVGAALAAATGMDLLADPWLPERSVWPLLGVVDEALGEPWLAPLATHIGASPAPGADDDRDSDADRRDRRFSTVRHLADLFDRYGVHRPQLLRSWAAGETPAPGTDAAWQAELWRRLRERIGLPSPAERLAAACEVLVGDPGVADLPSRLSVFGLTRLPASYLDALVALARGRDIHLWLLHPSPVLWRGLAAAAPAGAGPRRSDLTAAMARHPLLRSWGRDAREMQLILASVGAEAGTALPDPDPIEPPTLLGRIQTDIRANREPSSQPSPDLDDFRPWLAENDRSLQVHSCHGRARQVEVMRDAIVHLLADDPTLEPRDVIVMCPDIEIFAPLIQASFGPGREVAGVDLHVRLADRSLRQTNPVLGALARLLEIAGGRATASEILDLAGTLPVRARFGFDDEELGRLDGWIRSAGVRWGIDAEWRRSYHLASVSQGTWAAGMDRLLTGVAMSEEPHALVGGVLPLDDVDSGDIDLAGRAAELVARTGHVLESFAQSRTVGEWIDAIGAAAELLLATAPADEWQRTQLRGLLDGLAAQAGVSPGGLATELRPAELRALLADRLRGVPTRANFRTGHLTMCTLVPMRSVPHRVVCLLGLDDGAFPRRTVPDGDDLLAADPWVGDRDPRREDRQLLLDALLASGETLIISYSGRDERTNASRPPAVPVGELLDVVDRTVRVVAGQARDRVVVEHPLQPFDERNFIAGRLCPGRPWSFDRGALEGARAARERGPLVGAGLGGPLPPVRPDPLGIEDLVRFVEHPVRAFLRQRLGVTVRGEQLEPGDAVPIELDPLEKWQVGDRLLGARLGGVGVDDCVRAELARGSLPPGRLGGRLLEEMIPAVEALVAAAAAPARHARLVDVTTPVGGFGSHRALTLAGTVGEVFGDELRTVTYSRLGPKHRLAAWVRLVALSAAIPERPWRARSVGRSTRGGGVTVAVVGPLGSDPGRRQAVASAALDVMVDLYLRGMREPLPLAAKTSAAWAVAARAGRDPETAARREWVTPYNAPYPMEDDDPAHRMVHGERLPWDRFLAAEPGPDEAGPGWGDHPQRAGRLANRLWDGLLAVEEQR